MHRNELVGLWQSDPYDYGVMESTDLALLPDGTGWTATRNMAGALHLRRLHWRSPEPGALELAYALWIWGDWWIEQEREHACIRSVELDEESVQVRYTLQTDETVLRDGRFDALWLSEPVDFARAFGIRRRDVSTADDPTSGLVEDVTVRAPEPGKTGSDAWRHAPDSEPCDSSPATDAW